LSSKLINNDSKRREKLLLGTLQVEELLILLMRILHKNQKSPSLLKTNLEGNYLGKATKKSMYDISSIEPYFMTFRFHLHLIMELYPVWNGGMRHFCRNPSAKPESGLEQNKRLMTLTNLPFQTAKL
jgi:hypothetical protein